MSGCARLSAKSSISRSSPVPGASPLALKQAGVEGADMMLAVTPNNEVNIVACSIAALYDVPSRIARLRGQEYAAEGGLVDLTRLGITALIQPEQALVDNIMQFLETPHAVESANFENGRILMRGYRVRDNMPLANKTPREIREEIAPDQLLFAAIVRDGVGMIPDGEMRIETGDILYTLFPPRIARPVSRAHRHGAQDRPQDHYYRRLLLHF